MRRLLLSRLLLLILRTCSLLLRALLTWSRLAETGEGRRPEQQCNAEYAFSHLSVLLQTRIPLPVPRTFNVTMRGMRRALLIADFDQPGLSTA